MGFFDENAPTGDGMMFTGGSASFKERGPMVGDDIVMTQGGPNGTWAPYDIEAYIRDHGDPRHTGLLPDADIRNSQNGQYYGTPGANQFGGKASLDPAAMRQQVIDGWNRLGYGTPNENQINDVLKYAGTPDKYSDGKVRVGVNDYLLHRVATGKSSWDPAAAGNDTVIDNYNGPLPDGGSPMDGWSREFVNNLGPAPEYQRMAQGFNGGPEATYQNFTPQSFSLGSLLQNPQKMEGYTAPQNFTYNPLTAPQDFSYNPLATPQMFQGPQDFVAPTEADMKQDPGYKFRLAEMLDAVQTSAAQKGVLHNTNTLQALMRNAQDYASNEYGNVWNRNFNAFNQNNQNALNTYNTNAQTQMGAQAQQYGQAANAAQMNAQNQMGAQAQQFGQAAQAQQMNEAQRLAAYNANIGTQQQNFQNLADVYNMNTQNRFNEFNANAQNALAAAQLNLQGQQGAWDRNFQNANQAYNYAFQDNQAANAAAMQAYLTNYGNAMGEYQLGYNIYRNNQNDYWGRNMDVANLGYGATNSANNANSGAAANAADQYTGQGNATAAGQVGRANAWGGALNNVGSAAQTAGYYFATRPTQDTTGRNAVSAVNRQVRTGWVPPGQALPPVPPPPQKTGGG